MCGARETAPPHHMWYEAKIHQIIATELRAQDEEDTEGLMLLATSLQVCPCAVYDGGTYYDLTTDRQMSIPPLPPRTSDHIRICVLLVLGPTPRFAGNVQG